MAGHVDPSMLAYQIARDIEALADIPGLSDEAKRAFLQVAAMSREIGGAGRNPQSQYYHRQASGLREVSAALKEIASGKTRGS